MRKSLLFLALLFAVNTVMAQSTPLDCRQYIDSIEFVDSLLMAGNSMQADSLLDQLAAEKEINACPLAGARLQFVTAFAKDLRGQWLDAFLDYQIALDLFQKVPDDDRDYWQAMVLRYIAILEGNKGEYYSQVKYARQSVDIFEKEGDEYNLYTSAISLANGYRYIGQIELAKETLLRARAYFLRERDTYKDGVCAYNLADLYYRQDSMLQAKAYLSDAIQQYRAVNSSFGQARAYNLLGAIHYTAQQYDLATPYFDTSLQYAREVNDPRLELDAFFNLSKIAIARSDIKEAREQYQLAIQVFNRSGKSILDETYLDFLNKSINALEEERKKRVFQITSASSVFLSCLLLGFIYIIRLRNKRKLLERDQQQFRLSMMHELETSKKNEEIAELKKQKLEKEKTATDLEQKLRLSQEKSILDQAKLQKEAIEKLSHEVHNEIAGRIWFLNERLKTAIDKLDKDQVDLTVFIEIISELDKVKDVARNVDQLLERQDFNWLVLIRNLFHDIKRAIEVPKVSFSTQGINGKLPLEVPIGLGISLYQIINNCTYNALKHANAEQINCQLNIWKNELSVLIEDDGCGFDPKIVHEGSGLKIVKKLVDNAAGVLNVNSGDKGTVIAITIPLII